MAAGGLTYELTDKLLDGKLDELLREWRSADPPLTFDAIARKLASDYGIELSRETIRRWVAPRDLEVDELL